MSGDTTTAFRTAAVATALGFGIGVVCGAQWHSRWSTNESLALDKVFRAAAIASSTSRAVATTSAPANAHQPSAPPPDQPPSPERRRTRSDTVAVPIGVVHSCFSRRNGTPRQGGELVPGARCVFTLANGLPRDLIKGLHEYSHLWVIYEFHANTDKGVTRNGNCVKGKVRVPRLDGDAIGALATRTPHRPTPIGLSLGKIISVDVANGAVTLGGCDVVDGTPVLDLKPYVPFCDAVVGAVAPGWVNDGRPGLSLEETKEAQTEGGASLAVTEIVSSETADALVATAYLTSVKRRRDERLFKGVSTATSSSGTGGKGKGKHNETESWDGLTPDEVKKLKREFKKKRQAGLCFPDALYETPYEFLVFVKQVLKLDMRTHRERNAPSDEKKFDTYRVVLCDVEVEYCVTETERETIVTLRGAVAVSPLPAPGVTSGPERPRNTKGEPHSRTVL